MKLPDFVFPAPLAAFARLLPEWPAACMFATALNLARRAGKLPGEWDFLDDRSVRIEIEDLGVGVSFTYTGGAFRSASGTADVRFAGQATDLLKIALREEDPDTLFFQRRLKIEGDTELGLQLKNRLDSLELPAILAYLRTH